MAIINRAAFETYDIPKPSTAVPNPLSLLNAQPTQVEYSLTFTNDIESTVNFVPVFEDSADGSSWADVSAATATVVPGGQDTVVAIFRQYFRVKNTSTGSGKVRIVPAVPAVQLTRI